jgi:hypothetical protein
MDARPTRIEVASDAVGVDVASFEQFFEAGVGLAIPSAPVAHR